MPELLPLKNCISGLKSILFYRALMSPSLAVIIDASIKHLESKSDLESRLINLKEDCQLQFEKIEYLESQKDK